MRIFRNIEEYRHSELFTASKESAVTLGKFDGVHTGHVKLIREITDCAKAQGLTGIVFTIEMNDGFLLTREERASFLESLGVDVLLECPFSKEFMSLLPEEFVRTVLCDTLHVRYTAVGSDFAFGHNRVGDAGTLQALGEACGFMTRILEKERYRNEDVSSTRVRKAVVDGDMELVRALLGRPYPVMGIVRHGRHIGTSIGYPTVNLALEEGKILPPDGVYASLTKLPDSTTKKGLTNIGIRPTVGGSTRRAETTLLDFHSDLYGDLICLELLKFIRPETKFSSLEELEAQIGRDRREAWG